jgi:hypothetical protein
MPPDPGRETTGPSSSRPTPHSVPGPQRNAARLLLRRPDVELSARTRTLVGQVIRAHDDDRVDVDAFRELIQRWAAHVDRLPERERIEASLQVAQHAAEQQHGRSFGGFGALVW